MTTSHQVTITRAFTFDAAHILPWHTGRCSRMHGHTYRLEVSLTAPLNDNGVVLDFDDLQTIVHDLVLDHLDHTFLNDVLDNPTAERIALHILESLGACDHEITSVRLWEGSDSYVEVRP
jgi:6-pyruvoyltetrahydropterin/6-carboxytetrahydropterin synthase